MTPRPYQIDAVQAVLNYFSAGGDGHPLIVMPTGTGKSLVIAALIRHVLAEYPSVRVLMVTHVKELIQQNMEKLLRVWPDAPVGVYSAGLKSRETHASILFCGIQSIWNKAGQLSDFDRPIELVFIDEAHRVPLHESGTYRRLLRDLETVNPDLRVIGLTATPYRYIPATRDLSGGYLPLTEGDDRLFTDVVFDLSERLPWLINQGYLSPLWALPGTCQVDLEGIKIDRGDYHKDQLDELMAGDEVVDAILNEAIPIAQADDRRHWLVFCSGIASARAMTAGLRARQVNAGLITGDTAGVERADLIDEFRAGRLTALVSVGVLTTGFDAPMTDLLLITRPTVSPVLWVQMCGRGMRPTEAKVAIEGERQRGCLVLDFCGNAERHGPIDAIRLKRPGPKKQEPTKACPGCGAVVRLLASSCPECGLVFESEKEKDLPVLSDRDVMSGVVRRYAVTRVVYSRHIGKSGIPTLRVDYFSGLSRVTSEWVCIEHPEGSYPRRKAERWIQERLYDYEGDDEIGSYGGDGSARGYVSLINSGYVAKTPIAINLVQGKDKYPLITGFEWPVELEKTETSTAA